jgi:hypothetical protein
VYRPIKRGVHPADALPGFPEAFVMASGIYDWVLLGVSVWGLLQILRMTAVAVHDELYLHDIRRRVMILRNERIKKIIEAGGSVADRPEDQTVNI